MSIVRDALTRILIASACLTAAPAFAQFDPDRPLPPDAVPPIPEVRELLATVGDTPVYADELEPLEVAKQARVEAPGSEGFERWLDTTRQRNLQHRVIQLIKVRIVDEVGLVPTEKEIADVRAFRAYQQNQRLAELIEMRDSLEREVAGSRARGVEPPNEVLLELRRLRGEVGQAERAIAGRQPRNRDAQRAQEISERQFAADAVRAWKFTKHIHDKYGGKVLQMGANPEPIEAYLALFAEEQEAGRLRFETDWARSAVIGAFESVRPQLVDPLPDAFAVPWWVMDPTPAAE